MRLMLSTHAVFACTHALGCHSGAKSCHAMYAAGAAHPPTVYKWTVPTPVAFGRPGSGHLYRLMHVLGVQDVKLATSFDRPLDAGETLGRVSRAISEMYLQYEMRTTCTYVLGAGKFHSASAGAPGGSEHGFVVIFTRLSSQGVKREPTQKCRTQLATNACSGHDFRNCAPLALTCFAWCART
jgi:hypothetical protein